MVGDTLRKRKKRWGDRTDGELKFRVKSSSLHTQHTFTTGDLKVIKLGA